METTQYAVSTHDETISDTDRVSDPDEIGSDETEDDIQAFRQLRRIFATLDNCRY